MESEKLEELEACFGFFVRQMPFPGFWRPSLSLGGLKQVQDDDGEVQYDQKTAKDDKTVRALLLLRTNCKDTCQNGAICG